MAKFINKKEQVFDLKLTSYAKYLMSIGKFKPAFYAFYDDNVLYNKKFTDNTTTENQNNVDKRIKEETQYLESLVLFRSVERTLTENVGNMTDYYNALEVPNRSIIPDPDVFKINSSIGDAFYQGDKDKVPSWKVVALQSKISSSQLADDANDSLIPQVNVVATYRTEVKSKELYDSFASRLVNFDSSNNNIVPTFTQPFSDGKFISLERQDPVFYVEELNTELLTKNFDVEIFEVLSGSTENYQERLRRLNFRRKDSNIQNGLLVSDKVEGSTNFVPTTSDVEYYFDFFEDYNADAKIVCAGEKYFNRDSYYIDIDFECDEQELDYVVNDIYGSALEPEICDPVEEGDVCQE